MIVPHTGPVIVCGGNGAAAAAACMIRPSKKLALGRSATAAPWINVASRCIQT